MQKNTMDIEIQHAVLPHLLGVLPPLQINDFLSKDGILLCEQKKHYNKKEGLDEKKERLNEEQERLDEKQERLDEKQDRLDEKQDRLDEKKERLDEKQERLDEKQERQEEKHTANLGHIRTE